MRYESPKVNDGHVTASRRAGSAATILQAWRAKDIDLLACADFSTNHGNAPIDLGAHDLRAIKKVAKKEGLLIRGLDETGPMAQPNSALAPK